MKVRKDNRGDKKEDNRDDREEDKAVVENELNKSKPLMVFFFCVSESKNEFSQKVSF